MSRILGIISEYNPFHNGHLYQLEKSKELVNKVVSVFKKKEAKEDEQVVEEKVIAETDQSSQEGEGE